MTNRTKCYHSTGYLELYKEVYKFERKYYKLLRTQTKKGTRTPKEVFK